VILERPGTGVILIIRKAFGYMYRVVFSIMFTHACMHSSIRSFVRLESTLSAKAASSCLTGSGGGVSGFGIFKALWYR
jgi:hypothetical protein